MNGWPSSPVPLTCEVMTVRSGSTFTVTVTMSGRSMFTGHGASQLALTSWLGLSIGLCSRPGG